MNNSRKKSQKAKTNKNQHEEKELMNKKERKMKERE